MGHSKKKPGRLEVFAGRKRRDGKAPLFYFRHIAANGEIDAPSQGYTIRSNARRAARRRYPDAAMSNV